jgi:hypothetical protein
VDASNSTADALVAAEQAKDAAEQAKLHTTKPSNTPSRQRRKPQAEEEPQPRPRPGTAMQPPNAPAGL